MKKTNLLHHLTDVHADLIEHDKRNSLKKPQDKSLFFDIDDEDDDFLDADDNDDADDVHNNGLAPPVPTGPYISMRSQSLTGRAHHYFYHRSQNNLDYCIDSLLQWKYCNAI